MPQGSRTAMPQCSRTARNFTSACGLRPKFQGPVPNRPSQAPLRVTANRSLPGRGVFVLSAGGRRALPFHRVSKRCQAPPQDQAVSKRPSRYTHTTDPSNPVMNLQGAVGSSARLALGHLRLVGVPELTSPKRAHGTGTALSRRRPPHGEVLALLTPLVPRQTVRAAGGVGSGHPHPARPRADVTSACFLQPRLAARASNPLRATIVPGFGRKPPAQLCPRECACIAPRSV